MADSRFRSDLIIDPKRLYSAIVVFVALLLALTGRLWYLQILKGKDFFIASERNRVRQVTRPAPRGLIFDRNGTLMLSNRPFFDLVIVPQYLQDRQNTLKIVSELFNIPLEQIEQRLNESRGLPGFVPVRIKRNLSLHEVAMMESNNFFLPGVDVDTAPRRDYQRSDSAHLFGYLGEVNDRDLDNLNNLSRDYQYRVGSIIGKLGVEKKHENFLRGFEGKDFLQVDAFGRLQTTSSMELGINPRKSSQRGHDVYLTIDDDIQRAAVDAFKNKNGAVVAMNAQNGEILAYVSHPNFSLSMYQDGLTGEDWQLLQTNPYKPLLDKVTGGAYPRVLFLKSSLHWQLWKKVSRHLPAPTIATVFLRSATVSGAAGKKLGMGLSISFKLWSKAVTFIFIRLGIYLGLIALRNGRSGSDLV